MISLSARACFLVPLGTSTSFLRQVRKLKAALSKRKKEAEAKEQQQRKEKETLSDGHRWLSVWQVMVSYGYSYGYS